MIETGLRIGFSLVVVFALMWGIAKVARRPLAGRTGDLLTVVARQQMTRNTSIAIVRLADRALVVGITDTQVSLLTETDLESLDLSPATPVAHRSPVRLVTDEPAVQMPEAALVRPAASGRFAGSALSPQTWTQTVEFLRARTARK